MAPKGFTEYTASDVIYRCNHRENKITHEEMWRVIIRREDGLCAWGEHHKLANGSQIILVYDAEDWLPNEEFEEYLDEDDDEEDD